MSNIDWDFINGQRERMMLTGRHGAALAAIAAVRAAAAPEFSDEDIASALAKVEALPAIGDADEIATFWPVKKFGIDDLDFGDETVEDVQIADLYACTKDLSRQKLVWHVQNPGVSKKPGPFTERPIVLQSKKKQTIVDGEHRLAALMLLGCTTWPVYLVPK